MLANVKSTPLASAERSLSPRAVALMLMLCLSWGFNQIAVKLALPDIPPFLQGTIRSIAALPVLLLIARFRGVNIFARDGNQCQFCGKKFPTSELSLDHVVPRSQGGKTTWENIVCACVDCNVRKGGRTPKQAHMTLIRKPEKPKRSPLLSMKLSQKKYISWQSFLDSAYWNVELK